ncbi:MAG: 23S rRNA (guanosine(2251)-2'-O)-methyltransferase RlmB [Bacilli bacterium]|nr:23S rRNA (guanosine(2251)-2'-O)-methyltransferase RlmB [Bacilli bacterium]
MIVSGRNNVKEILKNFKEKNIIKKVICTKNFNEKDILSLVEKMNLPLEFKEKFELDRLAKNNHQGIIMITSDFNYLSLDELLRTNPSKLIILDHLEDPHNLGAIIRTVEASGVNGIIIPKNRTVSVNETVMKTSVGSLFNVNICQVTNLNQTIKTLKKKGFWIIGTDMDGENYQSVKYPDKSVLIIGSEGFGISRLVRESCDYIVKIPMNGKINSLNASVAAGIMIYELIRK